MKGLKKVMRFAINSARLIAMRLSGKKISCAGAPSFGLSTSLILTGKKASITIGKHLETRKNVTLIAQDGAIVIGRGVFFNLNCVITALERIEIGDYCCFGPNVMIFDHDHNFRKNPGTDGPAYLTGSIHIGKNVWVGAGCVILRGAEIGDNCVIGAGTVVKGHIAADMLVYAEQKLAVKPIMKEGGAAGRP